MIYSMTGFASATRETPQGALALELRTVNHRYLDVAFRLDESLRALEPALREAIFTLLPEGAPLLDPSFTTTQSERFFVTELIREALLERVEKELPFTSTVHLREFQEEETAAGALLRIFADIVVDRESQKGIVVGKAGSMIKEIGTAARSRIEAALGARVFLDLRVKARQGWREDQRFLAELEPVEAPWTPPGEEGEGS